MFFKMLYCFFAFQNLNKIDLKYGGGCDMRFNNTYTSNTIEMENIISNLQKKQLLGLLQNPSISRIEKLKRIDTVSNPFHFRFQKNDEFDEFA